MSAGGAEGAASSAETAASNSPLLIERHTDRVIIRLNRPEVRNAIDQNMADALHEVCAELEADPKVAILTGSNGVFAAGAVLAAILPMALFLSLQRFIVGGLTAGSVK